MGERYTADSARAAFHRIRRALGKRHAADYAWGAPERIGAWNLDSAPGYGGWVIEEQMNDGGGIDHPFGHERRNAREFFEAVDFALRVLDAAQGRARAIPADWDTCPHVEHLHIDESRESGDERRYVRHSHRRDGLLANGTPPATPGHEHAAHRAAGRLVS